MSSMTRTQLKEILRYDPDTGVFTWATRKAMCVKPGRVAGYTKDGYIYIGIDKKTYLAHRLAWLYVYGVWPKKQIDHIDGIRNNNKMANLRSVSGKINSRNQKTPVSNTSGMMGVCWSRKCKKWQAAIKCEGVSLHLGLYDNFFDACCARKSAERKYGFHENHGRIK